MLKVAFALSLLCTLFVPLQAVARATIDKIEIKGLDNGDDARDDREHPGLFVSL